MSARADFLAVDLGAESGRVFLGSFDGERIGLREVHRFPNVPVRLVDGLHWDVLRILAEIKEALAKAAGEGGDLRSIGVDAWGVDFALLDRDGALVTNPYHYRDPRTEGMMERAAKRVPDEELYRATGIQFMPLNTLYQLMAMEDSPLLGAAETLLMMPDLIGYWLTGEKACEYTAATTTGLYDVTAGGWGRDLMEKLNIPSRVFGEIIAPGTGLGTVLPDTGEETGLGGLPVTAVATHDTASAVVAVPARGPFAYISSGTWSLVGFETPRPVVTEQGLRHNFTNEGGFGGTNRFLRNVMGLWLLQECRRQWAREGREYSYEELVRLAEAAPRSRVFVDPDDLTFLAPGDMPARIRGFLRRTGQEPVDEPGGVVRCILESLALKYRRVLEKAEEILGWHAETVHVVGGGARNGLLCRLTAEAARRPVLAGPVEATSLGNALVQAYARGCLGSLGEIRETVRASVEVREYAPEESADEWAKAFERFSKVCEAASSGVEAG